MSKNIKERHLVSSPKHAFNNFGFGGNVITNGPKLKNIFMVKFNVNNYNLSNGGTSSKTNQQYLDNLIFSVRSADKPKINIDVQTLNQYNKKRLITQQVDYQASTMRFYDTGNGHAVNFLRDYLKYHFGDFNKGNAGEWRDDIISGEFHMSSGWGYLPQENQYFIDSIEVYQIYSQRKFDRYIYVNPKIQSLDFDNNDYATSEASEITMTFLYEGVIIETDQEWNEGIKTKNGHRKLVDPTYGNFDPMKFNENSGVPNIKEPQSEPGKTRPRAIEEIKGREITNKEMKTLLDLAHTGIDRSRTGETEATKKPRATPSFIKDRFVSSGGTDANGIENKPLEDQLTVKKRNKSKTVDRVPNETVLYDI